MSGDVLGHPLTINFKGNENHPSKCGAFLTILVQVLVLMQLIQKGIDMIFMNQPII